MNEHVVKPRDLLAVEFVKKLAMVQDFMNATGVFEEKAETGSLPVA